STLATPSLHDALPISACRAALSECMAKQNYAQSAWWTMCATMGWRIGTVRTMSPALACAGSIGCRSCPVARIVADHFNFIIDYRSEEHTSELQSRGHL